MSDGPCEPGVCPDVLDGCEASRGTAAEEQQKGDERALPEREAVDGAVPGVRLLASPVLLSPPLKDASPERIGAPMEPLDWSTPRRNKPRLAGSTPAGSTTPAPGQRRKESDERERTR